MELESILGTVLSVAAALGLAAACGFRVFVPMLVVSIAAKSEMIGLSEGFAWIGTTPALICFAVATAVEVAAYYIPVVDNFLDARRDDMHDLGVGSADNLDAFRHADLGHADAVAYLEFADVGFNVIGNVEGQTLDFEIPHDVFEDSAFL